MITSLSAGAFLTIDVGAAARNWRKLKSLAKEGVDCAAAVKTDAYGLGAQRIAPALAWAGCTNFFVAHVFEGVSLRDVLAGQKIYVLHGILPGTEKEFIEKDLIPVLNSKEQIMLWRNFAKKIGKKLPFVLHVDTGMVRLGLPLCELGELINDSSYFEGIYPVVLMSHLACADEPENPKNSEQLSLLKKAEQILKLKYPEIKISFANSAGIMLGANYHFDIMRPGVAIYGGSPVCSVDKNIFEPVTKLSARILEIQDVDFPQTIGYGATWQAKSKRKIATIAVGYGDGIARAFSNKANGFIESYEVSAVGRVSMDLMTFDITDVPEKYCFTGNFIDLINKRNTIDYVAAKAGTVGYEILTSLGKRYFRNYIGEAG